MLLRKCQKCGQELGLDKFSPNRERKDSLCVWCKECNRGSMQAWRAEKRETGELKVYRKKYYLKEYSGEGKERIKRKNRKQAQKCKDAWWKWFKDYYGEHPKCQVCGKSVKWQNTNGEKAKKSDAVCFDHRNGGKEVIKTSPSMWCRSNSLNDNNIKKWLSCDFGILCHKCNVCLPTKGRMTWLKNALKYAEKIV